MQRRNCKTANKDKTTNKDNITNNENKLKKTGRYKYFEMKVQMAYKKKALVNVNMQLNDLPSCLGILRSNRFVSQQILEDILFELIINESGRDIRLKNFAGQLQRDSKTGTILWRVYLETESATTGRRISSEVTKQLEENMEKSSNNDYGSITTVNPITKYKGFKTQIKCSLPNSEWNPGYFSQDTLKLSELLKKLKVQQSIKDAPEKYTVLISNLCKDLENKKFTYQIKK